MKKPLSIYEKTLAYVSLSILVISLIFLMALGFYNHPLGDDYYYGWYAKNALDNGSFFNALKEACIGVSRQYYRWQGTYSAMFLMHLPPHVFSDFCYKLYPSILLTLFTLSFFYALKPVLMDLLKATVHEYISITSITVFLCIAQVPLMGETFYWFNGSMYYTGYFVLSVFFLGVLIRFLMDSKTHRIVSLSLMAVFIAGGNYVSLLPLLIILALSLAFLIFKKKSKKQILGVSLSLICMLAGLAVSALAPGNKLRAEETYSPGAIKAILKSLRQGLSYLRGWSNVWLFVALLLLAPIFVSLVKRNTYNFKYSILICILAFGIFSSMSTPPFYAQNNGGAARAFDLSWYAMVILILGGFFYLLGALSKKKEALDFKKLLLISESAVVLLFVLMLFVRPFKETYVKLNPITAAELIIKGDAAKYDAQWKERKAILATDEENPVFDRYKDIDSLRYILYLGDLEEDTTNFNNEAFARFYGKKSVCIK